jgi:TonB family protein
LSLTMFSTLEPSAEARRLHGWAVACGILVEVLAIAVTILLGVVFPQELPLTRHYVMVWLPSLAPPKPPVAEPPRRVAKVVIPKLPSPATLEFVAPPVAELKVPKIHPAISSLTLPDPLPPPLFAPPLAPPKPKEPGVVRTGTFGGAAEKVTTRRPVEQVQTGGFGSPQGFPGKAQGESLGTVPKLGSFGLPDGPGVGNGTGGSHGIQGVVASAGFGSGIAGPGSGSGTGGGGASKVASAGFGSAVAGPGSGSGAGATGQPKVAVGAFEKSHQAAPAPAGNSHTPPPAEFQPVEILFKPAPQYTDEARRLGIQGEVVLSVVFQANGTINVTGVVKPLGHGLDQAAEQAAAKIRFKPAQRAGQPTDFPATLRIEFRLADQST